MTRVVFHGLATLDLERAAEFYGAERAELKQEFLDAVHATVLRIAVFPGAGTPLAPQMRRRLMSRFPYQIVYLTTKDTVLILAVAHLRRKPGFWDLRVPPN